MLVRAEGLVRSFGPRDVIRGATLTIEQADRIGLVGPNGCGKTTLVRMLTGELEPDSGEISVKTDRIGYLPQFPEFSLRARVRDVIGTPYGRIADLKRRIACIEDTMASPSEHPDIDWTELGDEYSRLQEEFSEEGGHKYESMAEEVLKEVGLDRSFLGRRIGDLSGGERGRVLLARVLIQAKDVDLLFLDEPTNHLDVKTIEWLEDYLADLQASVLMISHDRYFLDRTCTKIMEIEDGKVRIFNGNFSKYLIAKETEFRIRSAEAEHNRIERERQARVIEEQKRKWKYKTTFKTRQKLLDKTDRIDAPRREHSISMRIDGGDRSGKNVVMAEDLKVLREGRLVIGDVELDLEKGDRMGVFGPNGSGKTTFLKTLTGELPHKGELWIAPGARTGYFSQGQEEIEDHLTPEQQMLAIVGKENKVLARGVLAKFLVTGKDAEREISTLSGGEKARVALAALIAKRRNLLLLDEPTNHLDIRSKSVIENALRSFKGSIIVVTHDRFFLDAVCNKIAFVNDGKMVIRNGNYSSVRKDRTMGSIMEQAEAYRVVSGFTDWKTRTKYRAGERVLVADSEKDRYEQAIEKGFLKRIRGNEKKKIRR